MRSPTGCGAADCRSNSSTGPASSAGRAACHGGKTAMAYIYYLTHIHLGKRFAIRATHADPIVTYATIEGGSARIDAHAAPLIAIPTTAGTGSEVARGAIIILNDGRKLGFHSWHLLPKSAICDPGLTLGLPPMLTAATGMDAIAHCIETFLAPAFNPPAHGIAL